MKTEFKLLGSFLSKNTFLIGAIILTIVTIHGVKFFTPSYSIDTELMMTGYDSFLHSWVLLERYALVFVKQILFPEMFNLELASILTYIALALFCITLSYFVIRIQTNKMGRKRSLFLIPLFLLVSTNLAEQLYFVLQSFEVVLGMIATVVALLLTLYYVESRKLVFLALSIPFVIFSIMSYQSLVLFYAAGLIIMMISLTTWRYELVKKTQVRLIALIVATAALSVVSYWLISKGYMAAKGISASGYLSGQIPWGKLPLSEVLHNTYHSIKTVVLGQSNYYNKSFLFGLLGVALVIAYQILKRKGSRTHINGLYFILLFIVPFLLTVVLGGVEVARARMPALQLVIGFSFYFMYCSVKKPLFKRVIVSVAIILSVMQGVITSNLIYSEQQRYYSDVHTATRIVTQLDGILDEPYSSYTLLIAGNNYHLGLTNYDSGGEMLGRSFFEFDQTSPGRWATSYRVANFMQTLGYNFKAPSQKDVDKYISTEQVRAMAVWPQRGGMHVDEDNKIIIVKMSEWLEAK